MDLKQAALTLMKTTLARDRIVDQSQQFWDQLQFDAYFRGMQNRGFFDGINGRLQFIPQSITSADRWSDTDADPAPDYNFNLFKRAVRMYTALFGVREPNVYMDPINRRDQRHVRVASIASRISQSLDVILQPRVLQSELAFKLGKSGTVFGYTRIVASDEYGVSQVADLVEQQFQLAPPSFTCQTCGQTGFEEDLAEQPSPYCPGCGSSLMAEDFDDGLSESMLMPGPDVRNVNNISLVCTLHTLASVTIPEGYRRLEDCPWIALVEEIDIGKLSQAYNIPVSEIHPTAAPGIQNFTGTQARAAIGSYNGRTYAARGYGKGTRGIYWIQPSKYNEITDTELRETFRTNFPRGIKLTVVGSKAVRIEHESHTEVWTACLPEESDTLLCQPYLSDSIPLSDVYNDAMEISIEGAERSVPVNIFDPDILQADDLRAHGRRHASFIPSKTRGRDLSHAVQAFKPAEFHPEMVNLAETIFSKHDEMQGMLPILWGSVAGAETAYETSSAKNQALAMLAIPWVHMRKFHEDVRRQAVLQVARYSNGVLYLPVAKYPEPSNAVEIATPQELEEVLAGGWMTASDEQMPQSTGQIKQELMHLITQTTPEVVQALGLLHPTNLPAMMSALNLPGFQSPVAEAVDSANQLLQDLLRQQPIPSQTGGMSASEQLDPYLYEPGLIATVFKPWLVSSDGRQEREVNEAGWANVRLYAQEAEMYLKNQQMQQSQTGPPPPNAPPQGQPTPPEGVQAGPVPAA